MIEKTAISLIVAFTTSALLQDTLSCQEETCLKPDGNVVYYNNSEGRFRYNTKFISFTTKFQTRKNLNGFPMIPIVHDGVISLSECQCQSNFCIRKCCPTSSIMDVHTGRCMDDEVVPVKGNKRRRPTHHEGRDRIPCFGYCPAGKEVLIASLRGGMYFIFDIGALCTIHAYGQICFKPDEFCIDYVSSPRGLAVASCRYATEKLHLEYEWGFFKVNEPIIHRFVDVALLISILSLTVAFLVYSCFRELRSMHGKCLLCHIASFIVHDVLLIFRRHRKDGEYIDTDWICLSLDIADYLFYLAPFSWMNVICFDILMSFMSLRPRHANSRKAERKKFAFYSLYSWTTPLLAYFTSLIIDLMSSFSGLYGWYYHNGLGISWCSRGVDFLLKYGRYPMSVYSGISAVLFMTTAIKIYRINTSTSILRHEERVKGREENKNKHSFKIYAKLLVVMGFISWVIEPIHYVASIRPDLRFTYRHIILGYAADFFRGLQGLYISVFFLWNGKIINLVKEKVLKYRAEIIQHCFPQSRNVEPISPPESSSQASRNPLSSVVTVTTCQGGQGSISESGYMESEKREKVSDFNVLTGKPVEDTPSQSLEGSSCTSLIPVGDTDVQVSFGTASRSHEMSRF